MTRKECLEKAIGCVCQDRENDYGSPENSFDAIAKLWTAYLDREISSHDVGMMMSLMKIARLKSGRFKEDSYIDAAGYIACAAEIGTK